MENAPPVLDGLQVLLHSFLDDRHRATGACRHFVGGIRRESFAALAICRGADNDDCFLFYCDENWSVVTDTWHRTLDDAEHQAEWEFEGVTATRMAPRDGS